MARTLAASMPPMTVVPITLRATAPEPLASQRGTHPRMNAKEVIRMGLSLIFAPSSAASSSGTPCSYRVRANSTINMAFLAESPISMIRPIWANTLFSIRRAYRVAYAPNTATGTPRRTLNGSDQLS